MSVTISGLRTKALNISSSGGTYTVTETGKIHTFDAPAIHIMPGADNNILNVSGDLFSFGRDAVGVLVEGSSNTLKFGSETLVRSGTGVTLDGLDNRLFNSGEIQATQIGVRFGEEGNLTNSGIITGFGAVLMETGGILTNRASGEIYGGDIGISIGGASGKIVNAGYIGSANSTISNDEYDLHIVNKGRIDGDIYLRDGSDTFDNRLGEFNGRLYGGYGNDLYIVSSKINIVEDSGAGRDAIKTTISYVLPAEVEVMQLAGNADINATGNASANEFFGNSGNNIINGRGGDDMMRSGAGSDIMTGGAGSDSFMFFAGDGFDTITDYEAGTDKIGIFNFAGIDEFSDLTIIDNARTGDDVWIELGDGQRIIIENSQKGALVAGDFEFL